LNLHTMLFGWGRCHHPGFWEGVWAQSLFQQLLV